MISFFLSISAIVLSKLHMMSAKRRAFVDTYAPSSEEVRCNQLTMRNTVRLEEYTARRML